MDIDVEAEFRAEFGNVRAEIAVNGVTVRFLAHPTKMQTLCQAMSRAILEAYKQMPRLPGDETEP